MQNEKTAELTWRDGQTPVSTAFDDPYFSLASGLEETRHVFLAGNELPNRLHDGFRVAELGFGTGLNMLALAQACPPDIEIGLTSFEGFPMATADIDKSLSAFPELAEHAAPFLTAWESGARRFTVGSVRVEVIIGDARNTLPAWGARADAWFLDGFSPAKNPELWEASLLSQVGAHTKTEGTFATYTAAGHVRQKLTDAGFDVSRVPGHGRKRHMSVGVKK